MINYLIENKQLAAFFSALGSEKRLDIVENIDKGISNPGELAKKMNVGRSTIEKHIRVLVEGEILEKNPGLSSEGQLRVYYKLRENIRKLLEIARN